MEEKEEEDEKEAERKELPAVAPTLLASSEVRSSLVASRVARAMQFPWCRLPGEGLHPNAQKWAEGWYERRWPEG